MHQVQQHEGSMDTNLLDIRNTAFQIIKERSFIRGDVTLSSGQKSDHYFDMKPTMLHPTGAHALCELILDRLGNVKVDYIGGIEMGAVPLIGPLVMLSGLKGRPIPGFFVRKNVKQHGTMKRIEGVDDLNGKHVVIVEDVTTTGQSAMKSIEMVQADGAVVSLVISLLDRQQGAADLYREAGLNFQSLFVASDFLGG